ncbi:MAG: phosphoribosylformylglycinamidine synthase I [Planctomycetota bacterium]
MGKVRVLVVRAAGINCDEEVMYCWKQAGAEPELVHLNALCRNPSMLERFQVVTIPGGFSYGDDLGGGVIFGQRIALNLSDALLGLVEKGGGILGICNGFQILVKAGLLPGGQWGRDSLTVTYNESARYEARWVKLRVCTDRCAFLDADTVLEVPVEHAEGRVVVPDSAKLAALEEKGHVAVRYVADGGHHDSYPDNPNGSIAGIAGLCDDTGRVFGLMPHPDRHFERTHHPCWTSRQANAAADGMSIFANAVRYWG